MNKVGIKILLEHGHFVVAQVTEQEVKIITDTLNNARVNGKPKILRGVDSVGGKSWEWVVWTDRVVGFHTFVLEPQQKPTGGIGSPWVVSGPGGF